MKLADQITLKELLRDKIHREIQGLRVSPTEFVELEQANQEDVELITKEIVKTLGEY